MAIKFRLKQRKYGKQNRKGKVINSIKKKVQQKYLIIPKEDKGDT